MTWDEVLVRADESARGALEALRERVASRPTGGIAVYENQDLASLNSGHVKFCSYGCREAQIESTTPPTRMPDIGRSINYQYCLVGTYEPERS